MKKFVFFLLVILLTLSYLAGQDKNMTNDDKTAIARAALDYIEGYYEGNASFLQPIKTEALAEGTRAEWGKPPAEQNIPAVYLLGRHGNVLFKYLSQSTMDRPSGDQLLEILKKFLKP